MPRRLQITFLGEQDGPPERELKARLIPILSASEAVSRAYLARVAYPETGESGVALCVRQSGADVPDAVVDSVHAVFSELFGVDQHLDVAFVTPDDEANLNRVCRPFFYRQEPN